MFTETAEGMYDTEEVGDDCIYVTIPATMGELGQDC